MTVVYWTLLASSFSSLDGVDTWSSISMHAINSLFCLSEVLLTHNPAPRWIWLIVDIIVLAMYLGLAYLSKYTLGFYGASVQVRAPARCLTSFCNSIFVPRSEERRCLPRRLHRRYRYWRGHCFCYHVWHRTASYASHSGAPQRRRGERRCDGLGSGVHVHQSRESYGRICISLGH